MTPQEAREQTRHHISRVRSLVQTFSAEILKRGADHDASKLHSPEVEMFDRITGDLEGLTYGSPEYEEQKQKMLGMALKHHYENNRHHPEHFEDGIDGMTLIDIVEMFCDWLAATERHADGDIFRSIEFNTERFGISPQLAKIFENTAELFRERKVDGKADRPDAVPCTA